MKISYVDLNSEKEETLIFIHGNSHAKNSFDSQLNNQLFKNFRLIALDLPGHGESDKASEYSLPLFSSVLNELINKLSLKSFILVGHSLGGHVALHALNFLKPSGLFLYGTPMLKRPIDFSIFLPNEKAAALSKEVSDDYEIEQLLSEFNYEGDEREKAKSNFLKTDPKVRTEILVSVANENYSDECVLLGKFEGKIKVLVSRNETLVNNKYIEQVLSDLEKNKVICTIDGGHSPHVQKSEDFNSLLFGFANDVFALE